MTLEDMPFQWGRHDCRTLVQGWLKVVGGYDHVIEAGNKAMKECKDARSFVKLMREQELAISPKFLTDMLGGTIQPAMRCKEGSIAIVPLPANRGWRLGIVDDGKSIVGITQRGLLRETHPQALAVEIE